MRNLRSYYAASVAEFLSSPVNEILGIIHSNDKIMQFALFAFFGLSNTLITVLAFNYGMQNKNRVRQGIMWGIAYAVVIAQCVTALFEAAAEPPAGAFSLPEGKKTANRRT